MPDSNNQLLQELTPQWMLFAAEFAATLNIQKARDKSMLPMTQVNAHINDPIIQREIARNMKQICERIQVDQAYVLNSLVDLLEADITEGMDASGRWLPITQWTARLRKKVKTYELGLDGVPEKVSFYDTIKLIELVGRHVNVAAFEERHRFTHDITDHLAERLKKARSRAGLTIDSASGEIIHE